METLLINVRRFWRSAEMVYKEKDYTSATILYFKCLFVLLDAIIFRNKKKTPKDHTERFQILKESLPKYYTILDKIYPVYRDTYALQIEQEKCDEVRKHVRAIAKEQGISLEN